MHIAGTGIDYFPLDQAPGATITCARGTAAAPIAEFVLASILAAEKHFPSAWIDAPPERRGVMAPFGELGDKTLGLVGLGAIAQAIAVRALAFGMRVVAVRRTEHERLQNQHVQGALQQIGIQRRCTSFGQGATFSYRSSTEATSCLYTPIDHLPQEP